MYEIVMINNNGERFKKIYRSYYMYEKDLNKYKYAKNVKIVSYGRID